QLANKISYGNGAWWFVAGYGLYSNRSSFYWYRNVQGYPERAVTQDNLWYSGYPDNNFYSEEFTLSINLYLLNDLPARYPSGFVCQLDPSLPNPPNNNLNGSIVSKPSDDPYGLTTIYKASHDSSGDHPNFTRAPTGDQTLAQYNLAEEIVGNKI
uniref:Uncharacterized protein n=1 Tax=Romanomermis culicivorax TaxID=13658 RepID=A0A915KVA4_ROMCU